VVDLIIKPGVKYKLNKMKKIFFSIVIIIAGIFLVVIGLGIYKFNFTNDDIHTACTMEAKICPDGSAVGRTGPKCEFAACPSAAKCEGETCPLTNTILSEAEARVIAEKSCIKGGEALAAGMFDKDSKTWSYEANLNATREGCSSICVVSEATKTAEIKWLCTDKAGILPFDSGVEGVVTLGPTCPVMREGDTACADKPYATSIQVIAVGSSKSSPFTTVESDKEGKYKTMLPPGEYVLQPVGGSVPLRCETKNITIEPSKIIKVNLSCDSGIR